MDDGDPHAHDDDAWWRPAVPLGYDRSLKAAIAERLARAVMQDERPHLNHQHGLVTVVQHFAHRRRPWSWSLT